MTTMTTTKTRKIKEMFFIVKLWTVAKKKETTPRERERFRFKVALKRTKNEKLNRFTEIKSEAVDMKPCRHALDSEKRRRDVQIR